HGGGVGRRARRRASGGGGRPDADCGEGQRVGAGREAAARLRRHRRSVQSGVGARSGVVTLPEFIVHAEPPPAARAAAARAFLDTIGVALAGASEPVARIVQRVAAREGAGANRVFATGGCASATNAALVNGTAAHALDYDDMC